MVGGHGTALFCFEMGYHDNEKADIHGLVDRNTKLCKQPERNCGWMCTTLSGMHVLLYAARCTLYAH